MDKSFGFSVQINQTGVQTKDLINPRSLTQTIQINCEPPASQMLLWAEKEPSTQSVVTTLPRSRPINNVRTRFVLVNSKHYLRLLMLDINKYASIDH